MQHFTGGALHVRAMQSSSRRELYWLTGELLHAKTLRASAQLRVTSRSPRPPLRGVSPLSLSLHSGLSLCGAAVVSGPGVGTGCVPPSQQLQSPGDRET